MNNIQIKNSLLDSQATIQSFVSVDSNLALISKSIDIMIDSIKSNGRILSCGNGGSMCDSMHFAEELTGRYRKDRAPIAALSMGDPSHMSCVANDFGYQFVFSRLVEAWGQKGDTLLAISTSGNSKNIIEAAKVAKARHMKVIGLLGKDGGELKNIVDVPIIIQHQLTDRIQEMHIKLIHIFIEGIERSLYPDHY